MSQYIIDRHDITEYFSDKVANVVHEEELEVQESKSSSPTVKASPDHPKRNISANTIIRFHHYMRNATFIGRFTGHIYREDNQTFLDVEYYSGRSKLNYWVLIENAEIITEDNLSKNPNECYKLRKLETEIRELERRGIK